MYQIDFNSFRSIKGFDQRVRFIIIHYTSANFTDSLDLLAGNGGVSSHYLIPDLADQTYINAGFKDMRIFNMVNEDERAWHAGVSFWAGRTNINDSSIGIENVNLSSDNDGDFKFLPYGPEQIDALKELILNILQRYPDIPPTNILGHSDISPGRKSDPGATFPWKELYDEGIGAWYDEGTKEKYENYFNTRCLPSNYEIISALEKYGYYVSFAIDANGLKRIIQAFQLHFRPGNYNGEIDIETIAILYALIEKYRMIS